MATSTSTTTPANLEHEKDQLTELADITLNEGQLRIMIKASLSDPDPVVIDQVMELIRDHEDRDDVETETESESHLEEGWFNYLREWYWWDCECLAHVGLHANPPETRETYLFTREIFRKLMAKELPPEILYQPPWDSHPLRGNDLIDDFLLDEHILIERHTEWLPALTDFFASRIGEHTPIHLVMGQVRCRITIHEGLIKHEKEALIRCFQSNALATHCDQWVRREIAQYLSCRYCLIEWSRGERSVPLDPPLFIPSP